MCCVFVEQIPYKKTLEDHARRSMEPKNPRVDHLRLLGSVVYAKI